MKIALVEDEIIEYKRFNDYILKICNELKIEINLVYFNDPINFLNEYSNDYDAIFMDIELPNMSGMDASHKLRKIDDDVIIIFVTNLSQFAIEGYSVNAMDYILKPCNYYRLKSIIGRINNICKKDKEKYIVLNTNDEIIKIKVDDIYYFDVENHFVFIHTKNNVYKEWGTLKSFVNKVDKNFALCNQCYLVNLKYVEGVIDNYALIDNQKLLISRNKKKQFLNVLSSYLRENY